MKHSEAIALAAAIFTGVTYALPTAHAVVHKSIFTNVELSLKHPQDSSSKTRLLSIAADGLVALRLSDGTTVTARAGDQFRDSKGHVSGRTLVSITPEHDAVVVRYEMRVYLIPPAPTLKKHQ